MCHDKISYSKKIVTVAHRIGLLGTKYVTVVVVSVSKLIVEYIKNNIYSTEESKVSDSESLSNFNLITENFKMP